MVKKINEIAMKIKALLDLKFTQAQISRKLKISIQRVNYWVKTPITTTKKRRTKLNEKFKQKIIDMAKDKLTSDMGSRKIARIINNELKVKQIKDKKGRIIQIKKSTICNYLNKSNLKKRKIRPVFFLTKEQKKKRVEFAKFILSQNIDFKQVFWTDETKIDLGPYTNDEIRLSPENQEKLKKGDPEGYKLINRPKKKFEKSIMIGGGICYYGLSNLLLLEGSENEFSYAQAIMYYKEDIDKIKAKYGCKKLLLEQDGATSHTSKSNINLINKLFGKKGEGWLQNPPNSPDLAYPIETLWSQLKERVKNRLPETIEQLKEYTIEEWNKFSSKQIQKYCINYIKRLKTIIEIDGERIEPYHEALIRKEMKNELGENEINSDKEEKINAYNNGENKEKLKLKSIYNQNIIEKLKKKEIIRLNEEIEEKKEVYRKKIKLVKSFKKRDLKFKTIGEGLRIERDKVELPKKRDQEIEDIKAKIKDIGKMDFLSYLRYMKEEKEKKNIEIEESIDEDESTMDEMINKILKIKKYTDKKENNINYMEIKEESKNIKKVI